MKINEETTVSEEQVLFNKLNWENQQMILRIMRCLQPCELSCEVEEEKKIPEKLKWNEKSQHNVVTDNTKKTLEHLLSRSEQLKKSINEIIDYLDYLKSKGE